jgi:SIR2-like domain
MLMVIFGAGASYDSSPTYTPGMVPPTHSGDSANNFFRLPLAKDLFENRPLFMDAIDAFPPCRSIVPRLRDPAVMSGQKSIEAILQRLEEESQTYPRGQQELLAVRCYLHRAIFDCQEHWRGVTRRITNYLSLLREIEIANKDRHPVCLVTFNYDTLLEDALEDLGLRITTMDDYFAHPFFRLFKLHGSVNWAQPVNIQIRTNPASINAPLILRELLDRFTELDITGSLVLCNPASMGIVDRGPVFPAIAVPVQKKAQFACPGAFLDRLVELLPHVCKILIVGWRATEDHFLQLLRTHLRPGVKLYTVAATDMEAVNINRKMMDAMPGKFSEGDCKADPSPTGFTEFMRNLRVTPFLQS